MTKGMSTLISKRGRDKINLVQLTASFEIISLFSSVMFKGGLGSRRIKKKVLMKVESLLDFGQKIYKTLKNCHSHRLYPLQLFLQYYIIASF